MAENWILYLKFVVIIALAYFLIRGILRNWQLRRFYRKLKSAVPISANNQKGDYVSFSGILTLANMKTPVSKQSCGYWGLIIRAVFQTKEKKPGKGMQTHRPVIYKNESDQLPLIVANQKQLVHLAMNNPLQYMVNMNLKRSKSSKVPVEEAKSFVKPKYKKFEVDEYWLPEKVRLQLWAVVTDTNKNCISVSTGNNSEIPTLIYNGDKKSVFRKFTLRFIILFMLILFSPLAMYWLITVDPQSISDTNMLVAEVSALLVGYALYRIGRIHFVR